MIHLYFKTPPQPDRYFPGDRYLFNLARKLFRKSKISGVKKVFDNLCKGFDELGVPYTTNLPFTKIQPGDAVIALGAGRYALKGYQQPNRIIAGIGLMTHPFEWPDLCTTYPIARYLQHSAWANNVYTPYFGANVCKTWPAGVDTEKWQPTTTGKKTFDILIYNKIRWQLKDKQFTLLNPIVDALKSKGLSYREIVYGQYIEAEYFDLLKNCRAMIFLCEHESQGFACCEALAMDVPVLAWDQGYCLDPNRFLWKDPVIPATSVPFFDERCGDVFTDITDFDNKFIVFWNNVLNSQYSPRNYVIENITLKKSAQKMLALIAEVYP